MPKALQETNDLLSKTQIQLYNMTEERNARQLALQGLAEALEGVRLWVILATGRDPNTTHPHAIKHAQDDLEILDAALLAAKPFLEAK